MSARNEESHRVALVYRSRAERPAAADGFLTLGRGRVLPCSRQEARDGSTRVPRSPDAGDPRLAALR